jgi:SAM-dependent methyltransferase
MLTRQQARDFYDRYGDKNQRPKFYERKAIKRLVEHADFETAESIVEFGCGAGRLADRLMTDVLPNNATYAGFDLSDTMVQLTRKRLIRFGSRVSVTRTDGRPRIPMPPRSCDRFVSTYVLDLLSTPDISRVLEQAWKVLRPNGTVCLTCLTYGSGPVARCINASWLAVHSLRPSVVRGARPISLADYMGPASWKILHSSTVLSWGVPSQVVIARPRAHSQGDPGAKKLQR